jgi:hypothetical protein
MEITHRQKSQSAHPATLYLHQKLPILSHVIAP